MNNSNFIWTVLQISAPKMALDSFIRNHFPVFIPKGMVEQQLKALEFQVFMALQSWKDMLPAAQVAALESNAATEAADAVRLAGSNINIQAAQATSEAELRRQMAEHQAAARSGSAQEARASQRNAVRAALALSCDAAQQEVDEAMAEVQRIKNGGASQSPSPLDQQAAGPSAAHANAAGGGVNDSQPAVQQQQQQPKKMWEVDLMSDDEEEEKENGALGSPAKVVQQSPSARPQSGGATLASPVAAPPADVQVDDQPESSCEIADSEVIDLTIEDEFEDVIQSKKTTATGAGVPVKAEPAAVEPEQPPQGEHAAAFRELSAANQLRLARALQALDAAKDKLAAAESKLQEFERTMQPATETVFTLQPAPSRQRRSQQGQARLAARAQPETLSTNAMQMGAVRIAGHRIAVGTNTDALSIIPDEYPEDYSDLASIDFSLNPDMSPSLYRIRGWLLAAVKALELPANPLDDLINQLGGPENVAELTGRSVKVGFNEDGVAELQKRKADVSCLSGLLFFTSALYMYLF